MSIWIYKKGGIGVRIRKKGTCIIKGEVIMNQVEATVFATDENEALEKANMAESPEDICLTDGDGNNIIAIEGWKLQFTKASLIESFGPGEGGKWLVLGELV